MVKCSSIFQFFFISFLCNWNSAEEVTLKVTTVLNEPYAILKRSTRWARLTGNDQYEGYAIDLMNAISERLKFNYTISDVRDKQYGSLNKSGQWDGMIGELLARRADIAIGDLTITYEREQAVDFSAPFMNTGISILYERPHLQPPSLFAFMGPFSVEVWICIALAYLGVSVLLWILARFTPPLNPQQDKDDSEFSLINCMFLPRALSTRFLVGTWWFFVLIMVSIYSYGGAAYSTIETAITPIANVQDLAKQTEIKYGVASGGSTESFFRNADHATYKKMWKFMESSNATAFQPNYGHGIERVIKGNGGYAFLMESAAIQYHTERYCTLTQIGGMLDSKSYGIAMRKDAPFRSQLNVAILKLQEDGTLSNLKNRWWKLKSGGGSCRYKGSDLGSSPDKLRLANVGGVFVVLIIGLSVACIIAVCESKLKKSRKESAV